VCAVRRTPCCLSNYFVYLTINPAHRTDFPYSHSLPAEPHKKTRCVIIPANRMIEVSCTVICVENAINSPNCNRRIVKSLSIFFHSVLNTLHAGEVYKGSDTGSRIVRRLFGSSLVLRILFVRGNRERELRKVRDKEFLTLRCSPNNAERHGIIFYCVFSYRIFPSTYFMEQSPS